MINYTLKCANDHRFDSWFQSAAAFDKLKAAGMVACAVCGDTHVDKAMMAPHVRPARSAAATLQEPPQEATEAPASEPARAPGPLSQPASPAEQALKELRAHVEANSDYVGKDFARVAREMYDGESPGRPIYGEAKIEDAKALIEDGVPIAPLPFSIGRKTN